MIKWLLYFTHSYELAINYSNPFIDYINDPQHKNKINEVIKKWITPTLPLKDDSDSANKTISASVESRRLWLPYELSESWILISPLFVLMSYLLNTLLKWLPNWGVNKDMIAGVLLWKLTDSYFITWEKGKYLRDYKFQYKSITEAKASHLRLFDSLVVDLVAYHTIQNNPIDKKLDKLLINKINNNLNWWDENITELINKIRKLSIENERILKFTKQWMNLVIDKFWIGSIIVEWLKQTTIKRKVEDNYVTLLMSVVVALNSKEDLILYFDTHFCNMWICTKDNFNVIWDHTVIATSLTNVLKRIFCTKCGYMKSDWLSLDLMQPNYLVNDDIIKSLFDDLLQQINHICPDELTITAKGKVYDQNKFDQINQAIKYWEVWFTKNYWKKKDVNFKLQNSLKKLRRKK